MATKRRRNAKAISNEEIVAALLQHGTIKAAAESIGTATRTIYDRMKESDFEKAYTTAKAELIRQALGNINSRLSEAIEITADIMRDPEQPAGARLQAAQIIINNACKFADRLNAADDKASDTGTEWLCF